MVSDWAHVEHLRELVGTQTYDEPRKIVNGYHIFFNGFYGAIDNTSIVGQWLAWNAERKDYIVSLVNRCRQWPNGKPLVVRYKPGEAFDISDARFYYEDWVQDDTAMLDAVNLAFEDLVKFIKTDGR